MKTQQRRKELLALLRAEKNAISGKALSEKLGVSRQIIVGDIAALKEQGFAIHSTHNGYILDSGHTAERVLKLRHLTEQTEDELTTIVDLGGTVVDVFVWHKVYGKVTAKLGICSRLHVTQFIEGVRSGKSSELMNITGGYHYHTITAESDTVLDMISYALDQKGYIAPEI